VIAWRAGCWASRAACRNLSGTPLLNVVNGRWHMSRQRWGYSGIAACAGIDGKAWTLAAGVLRGRLLALLALLRRLLPLPRDDRKVYWPVTNAADGCRDGAQVDVGTVDTSDEVPALEIAPV